MKKNKRATLELFNEAVKMITYEFPVVVVYSSTSMEAYFENGTRTFVDVRKNSLTYYKKKWQDGHGMTNEENYETYIKKLIYNHRLGNFEEFLALYNEFNRLNEELDTLPFEVEYRMDEEVNFNGLLKPKEKIDEKTKEEEDYPF